MLHYRNKAKYLVLYLKKGFIMKLNILLTCATVTSAMMFIPVTGFSQDTSGTNVIESAEGTQGAVAQAAMAQDLYAYGVANKNAISALAAAQIMMSLDIEDVEREMENKPTEGADVTETGEGVDAPADGKMMLASAREFAGDDATLLGLIDDAEAEGARGRMGGASRTLSRLRAGRTDIFKVPFYGNSLAELAIIGDGDADLDLLVTDANGNTMCLDRSYSDKLYCSWTPAWDGYFFVAVKNMGRIRNSYYILTN